MSQNDRILAALKAGPLCSLAPNDWSPPIRRTAARIQDLEDRGENIGATTCHHVPPTARHVRYELVLTDQMELFS